MKLTRELNVAAPLEDVWAEVAGSPRSGWITGGTAGGYNGSAVLDDLDDDEHVAGFHVEARERDGYGTAVGTITTTLKPEDDRTRVGVEANLAVTGGGAQVAEAALDHVARALEERLPGAERAGRRVLAVAGGALLIALFLIWRRARG